MAIVPVYFEELNKQAQERVRKFLAKQLEGEIRKQWGKEDARFVSYEEVEKRIVDEYLKENDFESYFKI